MPLIRLVALTLFPTLVSALDCGQIRFTLAPQALTQCGKTRIQLSLPPGTVGVQMLILRTSRGPVSLRSGAPQPLAEVAQYAGYSTPLDNDNTNDFALPVASGTSLDVFIADRAEACPVSLGRNVGPGRNSCELVDLGPPGNDARVPVPPPALPAPAPVPLPPAQAASSLLTTSSVPFFVVGPSLLASSSFMAAAVASVTASSEVSRPGLAVAYVALFRYSRCRSYLTALELP